MSEGGQSSGSVLRVNISGEQYTTSNTIVRLAAVGAGSITSATGGFLIQTGFAELNGLGELSGFLVGLEGISDGLLIVGVGTSTLGVGLLLITEGLGITNLSGINSNGTW